MYVAKFYIGWGTFEFKGEDAGEIVRAIEDVQSLSCLARMGRTHGTKTDQVVLDKLDAFLEKYEKNELEMDDIKNLKLPLSVGTLECLECIEVNETK